MKSIFTMLFASRRKRFLTFLMSVVVFTTTYALILPAISLTSDRQTLSCTYSVHQHTDDCYVEEPVYDAEGRQTGTQKVLVCGRADYVAHQHDDSCYQDGKLVCQLPEIKAHVHEKDCYKTEKVLSCGLEETDGHTHTDSCYTEKKTLTCTKPEHTHTDACYSDVVVSTEEQLICGYDEGEEISPAVWSEPEYSEAVIDPETGEVLEEAQLIRDAEIIQDAVVHHHDDSCYETVEHTERQLTCGMEEHTHDDFCYDVERELTCGLAEGEAHRHSASCYTEQQVLSCTEYQELHTHTMECYEKGPEGESPEEMGWARYEEDENGNKIVVGDYTHRICGKTELLEHQHGRECFSVNVLKDQTAAFDREVPVEGADYHLMVSTGAGCGIPEDAVFKAAAISEDAEDFDTYAEQALDAVAQKQQTGSASDCKMIGLFDLSIYDVEGNEIQPGAPISVTVVRPEMDADATGDLYAVHFPGTSLSEDGDVVSSDNAADSTEAEVIDAAKDGGNVSFEAESFSVYAIVEAGEPFSAQTITSLDELAGIADPERTGFYLSYSEPKIYFSSTLNKDGCFVEQGDYKDAAEWYFENVEGTNNQFYIYTIVNGSKKYMKQKNVGNNPMMLADSGTAFEISRADTGKFYIKHATEKKWLQHSNGGRGIRLYTDNNNETNSQITFTYADSVTIPKDYYKLDGQTWGIVYDAESIFCTALMQDLSGEDMVKLDTQGYEEQLFVPVESDLTEWTFHSIQEDQYYLTTKVDGVDKYLTIQDGNAVLRDSPVDNSVIQVVSGSGEHKGCYSFSAGGYKLAVSGEEGSRTFVVASDTDQRHCWLKFAKKSPLSADDYLIYTAKKISVANPAQPDHTQEVVLYIRLWNGSKYEFYGVNHDGSLLRCYDDGDVIKWVDDQYNTAVWTLTDYYKNDSQGNPVPNGYYSLQNNHSGEYIAPSLADSTTFADELAKLNLDGRYYQEDYTKITYWDDTYYSYVGLKVDPDTMKVVPCPSSQAGDFYFARIKEPKINLTEVKTVDNDEFGITMRMIDFNNKVENDRDSEQTKYFGRDSNKAGLLTTDIKEDGYPGTTFNNGSLGDLFAGVQKANHLFIQSIYDESGYFEYDSTMNYAYLEGEDFEVYDQLGTIERKGNIETMYHGQFMPYNSLINPETNEPWPYSDMYTNKKTVLAEDLPEDDPRYGEGLHEIPLAEADYFFGMEMSAQFTQTADGKDAWGNDIIFEFSGDDDFWFYVDGELVLDLGGVHKAMTGSVNFSTGEVIGRNGDKKTLRKIFEENYKKEHLNATNTQVNDYLNGIFGGSGTVFPDYTTHKMQVYYMERGKGASNLHMRFNLTAVKPGEVMLSKKITGSEDVDYDLMEFPYQVWYRTWETTDDGPKPGAYQLLTQNSSHPTALHQGTKRPVKYASTYTPVEGGKSYGNVFFLKPGEIASFDMPDNVVDYKIVECGVNMNIFKSVEANGTKLSGEYDEGRHDYETAAASIDDQPKVEYVNEVDPASLRTLTISKVLWDENGFTIENEGTENETRVGTRLYGYEDDTTTFDFRVYMAASESDELTLVKNKEYFFKDRYGNYCRWDVPTQKFVSLGIREYHNLAEHLANLTDEEKKRIVFETSNNGAVSKVPAGFSVEFRGMPVDAVFKVVEEEGEIPAGYKLIDYERDKGSYLAEGTEPNQGVIRANEDPHILVNNQRGWGLTVKKVWSDADFMESHDDIYFAVYVNGELLDGSIRKMTSSQTSLYYWFDHLKPGTTFDKYEVYEVKVNNPQVENGVVTSYTSVHKYENGTTVQIGGTPKDDSHHNNLKYEVTYEKGTVSGGNNNVRVDTVYNTRSGIKLIKTDWNGNALPNARFTLKDSQGELFGADTYTSDENGLITIAYLEPKSTYTLEEIKTPGGFQKPDNPWTIRKEANDSVTVTGPDGTFIVENAHHNEMVTVTLKNKGFSLQAFKVKQPENSTGGSGDPLAGAVFALYKQIDTVSGKVKAPSPLHGYESLSTGADGLIPKITSALTAGTYYLSEVTPPGGYKKLNGDLVFTVTGSGTVEVPVPVETGDSDTLVILNNLENSDVASWFEQDTTVSGHTTYTLRIPNELAGVPVRIIKTDQEGKPLEGAEFSLNGGNISESSLVSEIQEGDTEALIYANDALPIGQYTLTEKAIPDGYLALDGPVILEVGSEGAGINVTASINGKALDASRVSCDQTTGVWTIRIMNSAGVELPSTGGPGTSPCIFWGMMLLGLAAAGILCKRKIS